jgi:hypothetical protein
MLPLELILGKNTPWTKFEDLSHFDSYLTIEFNIIYSSSIKQKFTSQNCPRCPIINELEVVGSSVSNDRSVFQAAQGMLLYK